MARARSVGVLLDDAVDLARATALDAAVDPSDVGEHLRTVDEGEGLATHIFAASVPGYRGWVWAVTVSAVDGDAEASVCEAGLIPSDEALLAPPWIPWEERVQPGDLEPAMTLPYVAEDARLVPGYEATGDEDADELALWELGLGRTRVLGVTGRDEAADRWYQGSHGPTAPSAVAATATCQTCAFYVTLPGSWRALYGVCANEWSPSDGRVVTLDHGCGAHSETDVERTTGRWPSIDPVIDTQAFVAVDLEESAAPEEAPAGETPAEEAPTGEAPAGDAVAETTSSETAPAEQAETPGGDAPSEHQEEEGTSPE